VANVRVLVLAAAVSLIGVQAYAQSASTPAADALAEAARKGDAAAIKKLLAGGLNVNTPFRYGATALSYACDHGHLDAVKVLLEAGADVNVKDTYYGATPLAWASGPASTRKPAHAEIVALLLKHGATGKPEALMNAVSAGDAAMTHVILETGGFTAAQLSDALEAAVEEKHDDVAAMLMRAGAKSYEDVKLDAAQLARYAGTYRNPAGADLLITIAGDRLSIRQAAGVGQRAALSARSETTFAARTPRMTLTFRIENGKAVAFDLEQGGNKVTYTRTGGG
jgi:uncharacterized protein